MRRILLTVLLLCLFLQPAMAQDITFNTQTTTAFIESLENTETLDLLFSDATGKIPYVSLQDGLDFAQEAPGARFREPVRRRHGRRLAPHDLQRARRDGRIFVAAD
ncbi:MAG: hypothetical protein IKS89_06080, partial [Spirochaetales bacterium]|nr:hypothetical protein [Spirochaetales bacterium]